MPLYLNAFLDETEHPLLVLQNPVHEMLEIEEIGHRSFQIHSLAGQEMLRGMGDKVIDIRSLKDGMYLLTLHFPAFSSTVRIIKEN